MCKSTAIIDQICDSRGTKAIMLKYFQRKKTFWNKFGINLQDCVKLLKYRHVGPTTPRPYDTSAPGHLGQDGSAQNLRHLGSRKRHLGSSKIEIKLKWFSCFYFILLHTHTHIIFIYSFVIKYVGIIKILHIKYLYKKLNY